MVAHDEPRDEFLSEEDLDLRNLSFEELLRWWGLFLTQAQGSNDRDENEYSHGVFALPTSEWPWPASILASREPRQPRKLA